MGLKKTVKELRRLGLKQFLKQWAKGVEGITPLQQTVTTLWSFLPILCGIVWGIVVSVMGKTYWLSLVLLGSIPITTIQIISTWQKYKAQKLIQEVMNNAI